MNNIAIFASGSGTNAQRLIEHFLQMTGAKVRILLTNRKNAGVTERAKSLGVPVKVFDKEEFYASDIIVDYLLKENINWIILAGFLWLIPSNILKSFPKKIVNIHPALLPKYGGKGMYGMNVHRAVIEAKEKESGITIHYVNEEYDRGDIIFQSVCRVCETDTPETLAGKIHELEYKYFPVVMENLILNNNNNV
ncbi:MAG: phosphoribosylglycinamide formyltransferase [Prevotellaceae bacterium]|jgi:phosphoribosylglycinamide formyltransferase-1|nr:phosphoribosylglycinamide formyltransferase [Prevotellaceae bacterium]